MSDTSRQPRHGFSTRAIHEGSVPDPTTGAVIPPIYQTSTYAQDGVGGLRGGYEYSRSGNPTRDALQAALASLEQGVAAFTFGSGLAAQDTLVRSLLFPGDHVVIPDDAYGGTFRQFDKVLSTWGIEYTPAKVGDLDAVRAAVQPGRTKLVWVETPTNPMLGICDITAIAQVAHEAGALLVVDNTFASPYLQQPLTLGADVVTHSTTKYVGGHSDVVGGAVIVGPGSIPARDGVDLERTGGAELAGRVAFHQNSVGAVNGPFDAWLTLRGLKTLALRMERHCDNAEKVVDFLRTRDDVHTIHYPGLESHAGHDVAAAQMKRFGGMVSFQVDGGQDRAAQVCGATEVFTLAESLGGIESLIEHPGLMTHASVAGTDLEVPADLVRISVGIEDPEDLVADLEKALDETKK